MLYAITYHISIKQEINYMLLIVQFLIKQRQELPNNWQKESTLAGEV